LQSMVLLEEKKKIESWTSRYENQLYGNDQRNKGGEKARPVFADKRGKLRK